MRAKIIDAMAQPSPLIDFLSANETNFFSSGEYLIRLYCSLLNKKKILHDDVMLKFAVYSQNKTIMYELGVEKMESLWGIGGRFKLQKNTFSEYTPKMPGKSAANDVEVDLVVERPGLPLLCIEIKISDRIDERDIGSFKRLTKDIPNSEAIVISQDHFLKKYDHVTCYSWKEALKTFFLKVK